MENFIIMIEVPTHNNFKYFMFYDVLLTLARHACQQTFFAEKLDKVKN